MTHRTTRGRLLALAVIASVVLAFPGLVSAHAELIEAVPADGATVEGTPAEISGTFSEPLETDGSTFSLRNAAGERLAVGHIDPDDRTRLIVEPVPELDPGVYEVRWRAASADGHAENDTWSFTVTASRDPTPAPTPATSTSAAPSPSASPEPSPTAAPSPSGSQGPSDPAAAADGDVILPIIAALAIVLIAAGFLLSRRGRPRDGV